MISRPYLEPLARVRRIASSSPPRRSCSSQEPSFTVIPVPRGAACLVSLGIYGPRRRPVPLSGSNILAVRIRSLSVVPAFACAVLANGAGPKPLTTADLYKLRYVADVQLSPDGARVAY